MTHGENFGAEMIDLREVQFTPDLLRSIPAQVARAYRVLPTFEQSPAPLHVAIADPMDLDLIDRLHFTLRRDLVLQVADSRQLDEFIERLYGDHQT